MNPKELYDKLTPLRKPYEDRAETLSTYTIPYMFPTSSANESTALSDTYGQRYTAGLIQALASDIALALFPPSGTSFRLDPDKDAFEELTQGNTQGKVQIMAELNKQMLRINKELENQSIRPAIHSVMEAVISTQSVVVEKIEGEGVRYHSLRNFVVVLDSMGEPLKYVIREELDPLELPEPLNPEDYEGQDEVELYTMCVRDRDKWTVTQSVGNEEFGDESTFKLDELPYTYIGWTRQSGDKYYRPMAEAKKGTIEDYENINRALTQGSIAASKLLILVNPLGSTSKEDVANAANGDVVDGREDDIGTFKLNKNTDFQTPYQLFNSYKEELDVFFMSRHGASYQGRERVTAEEVRENAQELDKNKAGIYSILSTKLTKWLIKHLMKELKIKFDAIDVNVITGLDALGRNIESRKLDQYLTRVTNLGYARWIKEEEVLSRYANYEGVDSIDLIKTKDEVQKEIQAEQQAMAQQELLNSGANALGQKAGGE